MGQILGFSGDEAVVEEKKKENTVITPKHIYGDEELRIPTDSSITHFVDRLYEYVTKTDPFYIENGKLPEYYHCVDSICNM